MTKTVVGIYSLTSPEGELRSGDERSVIVREAELAEALRARGVEVVPGGAPYPEEDRVAASSSMARRHAHTLMDFDPATVIVSTAAAPRAGDVIEGLRYLERELKGPLRLILHGDERIASVWERTAALAGAMRRHGYAFHLRIGNPLDPAFVDSLMPIIAFHAARREARSRADAAIAKLKRKKIVFFGTMLDRSDHDTFDPDLWYRVFGVSVEARSFSAVEARVFEMLYGEGGEEVVDPRVVAALRRQKPLLAAPSTFAERALQRQLTLYQATADILAEMEAGAAVLNLGGRDVSPRPSANLVAAWLSDRVAPGGDPKDALPAVPGPDPDGALTGLLIHLVAAAPVASLRVVGLEGRRQTWRADAMPPSFFDAGTEVDPVAGTLRGDISVGHVATLARLARRGSRYTLATLEATTLASRADSPFDLAFDVTADADEFLGLWPGSKASVIVGAHAAALVETAHRLGLGYDAVDLSGSHDRREV